MTKELEALERLYCAGRLDLDYVLNGKQDQDYKIIETALKEYENLDDIYYDTWYACERLKENNNFALMFIDDIYCLINTKDNKFDVIDNYKINNYGIIDNGTKKKLKALEIIKEKQVNVGDFIRCKSIEDYNDYCCYNEKEQLTQEEYDLLKEVLL